MAVRFDGGLFRAARMVRQLTQQQLADRAGYKRSEVARIEAGTIHPSVAALCAFADALGVSVDTFFKGGPVSFADYERGRSMPSELGHATDAWVRSVIATAPRLSKEQARRVSATLFGD